MNPQGYLGWIPMRGHLTSRHDELGTRIARGLAVMTDENYFLLLVWTICGLMFSCGVVAFTHHPEWFGA
jgi:hypothetical protein